MLVHKFRLLLVFLPVSTAVLTGGCTILTDQFGAFTDRFGAAETAQSNTGIYGTDSYVRATVSVVKSSGDMSIISSRALRLPTVTLSAITAFDYQFPDDCGGHHFRVYETSESQILEFEYIPAGGERSVIRDYLSGPNSFVQPGLWTAYDHTADSISGMKIRFEDRGTGILVGTYSQGLFTGLESMDRRALGLAYARAVHDIYNCEGVSVGGRLDVAARTYIANR